MIKVKQFAFNPFGVNTFILFDSDKLKATVVDPGMFNAAERKLFDDFISSNNLNVLQVINTHMHTDHCIGNNYVRDKYGVKVAAHPADAFLGENLGMQARAYGFPVESDNEHATIDVNLADGDTIDCDGFSLKVLHVPGHSPGSVALYCPEGGFVIAGDALFRHSIGRADLPGGDHDTLIESIRTKLLTLPDETKVLPGHDMFTTIADERTGNPYLRWQ